MYDQRWLILLSYASAVGLIIYPPWFGQNKIIHASAMTFMAQNTSAQTQLTYDGYMNAGYQATNEKQYDRALQSFQSALKFRPQDIYAHKAIRNLRIYIYDSSMEKGYKAVQQRDYQTALNYFQQAANQRPQDFYAQQAISNVQKFAQREINPSINNAQPREQDGPSSLLLVLILLLGIIAVALLVGLFRLFQFQISQGELEPQDKQLKQIDPAPAETTESQSSLVKLNPNSSNNSHHSLREANLNNSPEKSLHHRADPVEKLLLDLQQDDAKKRRKAIWNLAHKGDSRAVKPLIQIMIGADSYERSLILEALSQISLTAMRPMNQALLISLQDENAQVRKNAIRDITKIYDLMNQLQPLIAHAAMNDPDSEVREIANWALNKFYPKQNNPQLPASETQLNATLITDDSE